MYVEAFGERIIFFFFETYRFLKILTTFNDRIYFRETCINSA